MGRKLTYNPDKPTIGTQFEKPATNEPASSVFARMSGRPAPAKPQAAPTATDNKSAAPVSTATPAGPAAPATPAQSATKPAVASKTTSAVPAKPSAMAGKTLQSRISSLASTNKIANVNKIYAGKTMDVGGTKYTIQKGDTLTSIAKKFPGQGQTTTAPTPPRKPSMGPEAPAEKPEPVTPSTSATPTGSSSAMKPDYHRTTLPGARTGDVTPKGGYNMDSSSKASDSFSVKPNDDASVRQKQPSKMVAESTVGANKYRIV